MKKNPIFNALFASLYIAVIVLIMNVVTSTFSIPDNEILIPMTMLGLLVLSVAVMAFLFGYDPFVLYSEGHKKEAVTYFAKTVGYFACFALILLAILIFTSL